MSTYKKIVSEKFGDVICPALSIVDNPKQVFSISPALDIALCGGVPEGSWVSFVGPPGCGKSTTALQLLASTQKEQYYIKGKKRPLFYMDVEHRLKPMNLYGVHGLDPKDITLIRSTPEKQLSAEEFLEILKQIIKDPSNYGGVAIIDSSSALCPSSEIADPISGAIRSNQPRIMASFCRQLAGSVNAMNFTVIMIQHLITNTSGYGEKWQTDGGEKIKYQLDVKLLTKGKTDKWEDGRRQIGQIIEWDVIKSALGQSGLSCKSYLKYGHGLDEAKEICNLATELGIIEKGGSWFSYEYNGEKKKYQGENNLYNSISVDPAILDDLFSKSKALLGVT